MERAEPDPSVWSLNPSLRVYPFDGNGSHRWLVELDDEHGGTQRVIVSPALAGVLERFRTPQSIDGVIADLRAEGWTSEGLDRLERTLVDAAVRRRLLVHDRVPLPATAQPRKPAYMTAMVRLAPPGVVAPLARLLSPLFTRPGLVLGVVLALAGQGLLAWSLRTPHAFVFPTAADVLLLTVLGSGVVAMHELGHAAAAWRAGARRVSIGVGWYVLIPVAYADLSETWRLEARQRALIDIAGVYVQAIVVFPLICVYLVSGNAVFLAAAVAASLSILWNLNPLLRMDGYWLLSDLLRVSHLGQESFAALKAEWNARTPERWHLQVPAVPELSRRTALALTAYAVACSAFFVLAIALVLTRYAWDLAASVPARFRGLGATEWGTLGWADLVLIVGGAAWQALVLYFVGRFVVRFTAAGARSLRRLAPIRMRT